jgi:hypothetical protein
MSTRVAIVVLVAIVLAVLVFLSARPRKRQAAGVDSAPLPGINNPALLTPAMPFGYKTAWFAIHSEDTHAVASALDLKNVRSAGWNYGIWHAIESDDYAIFVTPPISGWTLAVGVPVLYEADDHATERMVELSRQFGEVQLFASMRVSSAYVWARARDGKLVRRFYDADGQHQESGEPTDEEEAMGLNFFNASSPEAKDPKYWERKDLVYPDEEHVLQMAGRWSIDPAKLDQMGLAPAMGLIGEASATYPPKPEPIRR